MLRKHLGTACKAQSYKRYFNASSRLTQSTGTGVDPSVYVPKDDGIREIAVIGGGITGLASAYFSALYHKDANITLFESSGRPGGWLRSTEHNINGGKVIFEQGPRSLRPSKGVLALILQLGLEKDLLLTSKSSAAARNRYIYLDNRLVRVGPGLLDVLTEDALQKPVVEVIRGFFTDSRPQIDAKEETIEQFFKRRGCPHVADDLVSAMIHGIYAGDISQLSMPSILPSINLWEQLHGSLFNLLRAKTLEYLGWTTPLTLVNPSQIMFGVRYAEEISRQFSAWDKYMYSSIYTLKGGLQTLATALIKELQKNKQVKIITGASIEHIGHARGAADRYKAALRIRQEGKGLATPSIQEFDRVISTIPSTSLAKICSPLKDILGEGTASTVCVVNLFYQEPNLTPVSGFGYLIPKSTPQSSNPEGALGVVFDTDATPALDTAPGTKLTVMLGGPYWKDISKAQLPSNDEAISMAKGVLASHLGITAEPLLAQANVHPDCIPQYTVGHISRMTKASLKMAGSEDRWKRCIRVAGSSYCGVGVNDCITNAWATVTALHDINDFGVSAAIEPYKIHREDGKHSDIV